MKKNLTEIVFILDRSGSMAGLENDTIGGFNAMIEKQKKEAGEAYVSTVLFDHVSEVIHDRVDIQKIEPMTNRDYYVRGSTALLDAVGRAIHHIGNVHKYAREEDRPEKTLFVTAALGGSNISMIDDDLSMSMHNPALLINVSDKTLDLSFMTYMSGSYVAGAAVNKTFGERSAAAVALRSRLSYNQVP